MIIPVLNRGGQSRVAATTHSNCDKNLLGNCHQLIPGS